MSRKMKIARDGHPQKRCAIEFFACCLSLWLNFSENIVGEIACSPSCV